jgi:hypothetical protein
VELARGQNLVAKAMEVKVTWETEKVQDKLHQITDGLDAKIEEIFKKNEAWAIAWMKANAPWTDNTGRARAGLMAVSASAGSTHEMRLFYTGVNYGVWLEIANSGRFQILGPAMRHVSRKLLKDFQSILSDRPPVSAPSGREIPPQARKALKKPIARKSGSRRSRKGYGRHRNQRV